MATKARQQYFADEDSLQKIRREFSIADDIQQKIDSIEPGAQVNKIETVKVNGTALVPDANKAVNVEVPEVIDNLYTVDSDNALSAKQGKLLYDYIQNIASRGRFLSNWNSATGLPMTNPSESPYPYKSGDYFVVSNVAGLGGTNYRPDGSSYTIGQASTVIETEDVSVSDFYFYDGTNWLLLSNSGRSLAVDTSLSTTSTNPVENRVITNALNNKQDILTAGNHIDITNNVISAEGFQEELTAGENITIGDICHPNTQGPCPDGFHLPVDELKNVLKILTNTFSNCGFSSKMEVPENILKMPRGGRIRDDSGGINGRGDAYYYWYSKTSYYASYGGAFYATGDSSYNWHSDGGYATANGFPIRAFKDVPVQPDNTWTVIYDGSAIATGAGVFYNAIDGLISISGDGTTRYTMMDKNLGATQVYNYGDTLSDSNCGLYYQWGNNHGFPSDLTGVTTSTTLVDVTGYGPGNYYDSDVFIISTQNPWSWFNGTYENLWGKNNPTGTWCELAISATDTTYTAGTGINIDANNVISNTQTSAEWGNITGTLSNQTDLQSALDSKVNLGINKVFDSTVVEIGKWEHEPGGDSSGHHIELDPSGEVSTYNLTTAGHNEATLGSGTLELLNNTVLDGNKTATFDHEKIVADDGTDTETYNFFGNNRIARLSDVGTGYTAGDGINIDANNEISNTLPGPTIAATAPTGTEGALWYDTTNDVLMAHDGTSWKEAGTQMKILSYGHSTWQDFLDAYNENAVVYCRASSSSDPSTGSQGRLAFMAYVNNANNPTEVEFQYYRSRSSHSTAANVLDEVYVYKLVPADGGTWTVTQRDTAAKPLAGTGIGLTYNASGVTISADTSVLATKTDLNSKQDTISDLATIRSGAGLGATAVQLGDNISDLNNDSGYITANDLPAVDTSMSDSSTNAVQNNVIKNYVDTQVQEATSGAVSDIAYGTSWNGITGIAPSKNAVYDKISSMDTTISGHTSSISTINGKIPSEASAANQLADKDFVGDSINSVTAYYITKNAAGDQWTNRAELFAATTFYSGGVVRVPTKNDYTIVLSDEQHDNATTRYIYNNGWEYQYTVNETAMTQAQLNAINSGITSAKVSTYDGYATGKQNTLSTAQLNAVNSGITSSKVNTYDGYATSKQDVLTAGDNIDISNNVISADVNTKTFQGNRGIGYFDNAQAVYNRISTGKYAIVEVRNVGDDWKGSVVFGPTNITTGTISSWEYTHATQSTIASGLYYEEYMKLVIEVVNGVVTQAYDSGSTINNTGHLVVKGDTAPSNPIQGSVWYDKTNNVLKTYDGTNWNEVGKEYHAGEGISIGNITKNGRQGPSPDGFHVPSTTEWQGVKTIMDGLSLTTGDNWRINLHMPFAGFRSYYNGTVGGQGDYARYWSSSPRGGSNPEHAWSLYFNSGSVNPSNHYSRAFGQSLRCFKDSYAAPDSTWTVVQGTLGSAGIFWNQSEGLISITDGSTGYTIMDKNLGATTVYNDGDTLSEANCGKYYQRGNNYGFPRTGDITTSSTQVDASAYGPNTANGYYSSGTFITGSNDWSSVHNDDLWGNTTGTITQENVITNTGMPIVLTLTPESSSHRVGDEEWFVSDATNIQTIETMCALLSEGKNFCLKIEIGHPGIGHYSYLYPRDFYDDNYGSGSYRQAEIRLGTPVQKSHTDSGPNRELGLRYIQGMGRYAKYSNFAVVTSVNGSSFETSVTINAVPSGGTTGQVLTKTSSAYEWAAPSGGLQVAPNSPITGIKYLWYGTEEQYAALTQYYTDTPGDTEFHCF